jgi:N-acetylglucosamine-6-phosphate deacetylase
LLLSLSPLGELEELVFQSTGHSRSLLAVRNGISYHGHVVNSFSGRDPISGSVITVHCGDDQITRVESCAAPRLADSETWICHGLVDLQVNGYRGSDLNADDLNLDTVRSLARNLLATGVTAFAPTLITASEQKLLRNLKVIADARCSDQLLLHMIPFVHVEGPHIDPADGPRGAHPVEHVRPPDISEFLRWQEASGDLVGMVTLSPHYSEAPAYIRALSERGVHVSIGHTNATSDQIGSAVDAGARLSTHLGNGISQLVPRHPNPIWTQLADDRLTATFIADGHHLPSDTLIAMLRAKTPSRSILISDLVAVAGLPPGRYSAPVGTSVDLDAEGRLRISGTEYLAGATSPLKDCIARVASHTGFSLGDAISMATVNPGRLAHRGVLAPGHAADLLRFRWEHGASTLQIEGVVVQGKILRRDE